MTIVAFVPNLFDRSRFDGRVEFVDSPAELAVLKPKLVLVDLDRCGEISEFGLEGCRVVGFGPHVESELSSQALALGYDEVLSRSVFFRRLEDLLDSVE